MENSCVRSSHQDSGNADERTKRNLEALQFLQLQSNDSEITAALLIKKLLPSVEDENEYVDESLLGEFFNASNIIVKSWSSDSHPAKEENKFEIWRDAMYIAMETDTKHSEEVMKLLSDCDIIWSLETNMDDLLLHRLIRYEKKSDVRKMRLIEMLLKSGKINVNARDKDGKTALHWAHEEKLISLLIHYGADVNEKDNKGKTPLIHRWGKKVSVLKAILKEPRILVDLDAADCNGQTALMNAASNARSDVVELLLDAGASVNLSDHLGFTALHHALFTRFDHYDHFPRNSEELKSRKEIFTILFDAKDERCDCYIRNKEWIAKRVEIVEMLLGIKDIDVNALSFEQFSPLDMADGWIPQLPQSIKMSLKEKGANFNVFRQQKEARSNLQRPSSNVYSVLPQTETQSTSDFQLDVRCSLALQRLLRNVCTKYEEGLPVDLFEKRLMTLIDTFQDQIVAGKDQQGRTALHFVAISFTIIWAMHYWRYIDDNEKTYLRYFANTIVKKLITIGCSVNETDKYGRTPLHYANFILKDSLISHGADASIEDKDGKRAKYTSDENPQPSFYDGLKSVIDRNDETYFLRLMNNRQMRIEVQRVDSHVIASDNRWFRLKSVPSSLWRYGEYAFRHPSVEKITTEVIYLMSAIAKEIKRLDPRFATRHEFVGSSNEETKLDKPDEFDFCFVLTKISELCEVFQSPELPSGFVRLKRKPTKVDKASDFDSFFGKDGILNTEKVKRQFTTILRNALVNIERQHIFDCSLEMPTQEIFDATKKASSIVMIKPLAYTSVDRISHKLRNVQSLSFISNFTLVNCISIDIVPCIHFDDWWPDEAISNVSDEIKKFGCNLVLDSPHELLSWVPYSESCAMISFAKAESDMIKQSCVNAKEAYMIGKTMVEKSESDLIESSKYTLKNCLLYCIEALTPTSEKASQLGLSIRELKSEFSQMDRYLWLKCLMKCRLEFVSQDFCPCYFMPNFSSSTGKSAIGKTHLKRSSLDWMRGRGTDFPQLCRKAYAFYRRTSSANSESCCQFPAPDPLWERFDRNTLFASLCKIAYNRPMS